MLTRLLIRSSASVKSAISTFSLRVNSSVDDVTNIRVWITIVFEEDIKEFK